MCKVVAVSCRNMSSDQVDEFNVDNGYHIFTAGELEIMERLKQRMKGRKTQRESVPYISRQPILV